MDLAKMIADLQDERNRLDEAIEALERLSAGQPRRRGRPPKSASHDAVGLEEPKFSELSKSRRGPERS